MSGKKSGVSFDGILDDIRHVRVQGAENVARAGLQAFLLRPRKSSVRKILSVRPTEPLLQNALRVLSSSKDPKRSHRSILREFRKSHSAMVREGSRLITDGMSVFTHCHSSSVIDILLYARRVLKKKFVVYTAEVEPLLQGRLTARDLSRAGIRVVVVPDFAAEQVLSGCDLLLFGADAFTRKFVVNKIGTKTLCLLAREFGIPSYACGISLKFSRRRVKLEMRSPSEVWSTRARNVSVVNPAFVRVPYDLVTGVVSEVGVLSSKLFCKSARLSLKKFRLVVL